MPSCNLIAGKTTPSAPAAEPVTDDRGRIYSKLDILLICDGAAWHKSTELIIPENIELFFIPPYTPEMNPIEQIWKEIRRRGFQNEVFDSLEAVIDRLCFTIKNLPATVIKSITGRKWILSIF